MLCVPLHQQIDGSILGHDVFFVSDDVEEVVIEEVAAGLEVELSTGQKDVHAKRSRAHHRMDALAGSHQVYLPERGKEVAVDEISHVVGQ